jgi:hypothetical protein
MRNKIFYGFCTALLMAAVIVVTGCSESETTGVIIVTPSEITLSGISNSVTFVASVEDTENVEFFDTTLEWRVESELYGNITNSAGTQALYVRTTRDGDNYVYVTDGYDREGWAIIHQE